MTTSLSEHQLALYRKQEPCVYPVYGVLTSDTQTPVVIQGYSTQHIMEIISANHNVGGFEFHEVVEGTRLFTLVCDQVPSTLRVILNPIVIY